MLIPASGPVILIAAPSGSGKTSITRYLLENLPNNLAFSISAATRSPRAHERNGIDYYFISAEEFQQKISEDAFVEWEMVYEGKYYGTLRSELERIWQNGKAPLLDVDVQGGIHIQAQFNSSCLTLFIEPPSLAELERRLRSRGTETPESLEARINKASFELSFRDQFQHIIVNDDLKTACEQALSIVRSFLKLPAGNE